MATTKIPEQKVILCGEYGVGKSSIFRRFANNSFITSTDRQSTLGLDHYDKIYTVGDKDIKLQLWDTGGMERVASITSSYYKFAEAAILVFSLDNAASFHVLSQHLLDIVTYAENAKIYVGSFSVETIEYSSSRFLPGPFPTRGSFLLIVLHVRYNARLCSLLQRLL